MKSLMALLVLASLSTVCFAHETQILNCNPQYQKVKKVDEEALSNGMLLERYDTNADGLPDLNTLSVITGTDDKDIQHQAFPTIYIIDREPYDGNADYLMIDKSGDGFCESIVLYQELTTTSEIPLSGKVGL